MMACFLSNMHIHNSGFMSTFVRSKVTTLVMEKTC